MKGPLYSPDDLARLVADAVVEAANEHGAPNGFSPGWIARHNMRGAYATPMQVGRVAPLAVAILAERGWVVTYLRDPKGCSFSVDKAGEGYHA